MANAVIVVDMQNGFMRPDGTLYCGDHAREIIPRIAARVEREKAAGASLFFTQDSHTANDREFEMFPPHCIEGSEEEHIIDELAPLSPRRADCQKAALQCFFRDRIGRDVG